MKEWTDRSGDTLKIGEQSVGGFAVACFQDGRGATVLPSDSEREQIAVAVCDGLSPDALARVRMALVEIERGCRAKIDDDAARQKFVSGYFSLGRYERPNMHEDRFQAERIWRALVAIGLVVLVACNAPLEAPEGAPGPEGPRGPRGLPGAACAPPTTYVVTAAGDGPAAALCDEGDALTGGYCQTAPGVELYQGGPVEDPSPGWWCYGIGEAEPAGIADVYAYAICLEGS